MKNGRILVIATQLLKPSWPKSWKATAMREVMVSAGGERGKKKKSNAILLCDKEIFCCYINRPFKKGVEHTLKGNTGKNTAFRARDLNVTKLRNSLSKRRL